MRHLDPTEFVDALDGALAASRRRHLDGCDRCRTHLAELRTAAAGLRGSAEVPEPSPLFWQAQSDRIRTATREVATAGPGWGPQWGWRARSIGALGALGAAVLFLVVRIAPAGSDVPAGPAATQDAAELAPTANDEALGALTRLESGISYEALREVAAPSRDATDAWVAQLTPQERAELARLLQSEIGSTQ